MPEVFAFGTLKRGFPLHERGLSGAIFLGAYKTRDRYPMLVAGPWFAPMMFNEPGIGFHVLGELYQIDESTLAKLDRIESVGIPGNIRVTVDVQPIDGGPCRSAFAFMKERELAKPAHTGYLPSYEERRFIPFDRRSRS